MTTTEWEYDRHVEHEGKTYHLWQRQDREGFTVWNLTHQPSADSGLDFVKPGGGFVYTSLEGLCKITGMKL